ncbi:major facilitator superfamily transporter [Ceraceosorus guamensis]|uniref:Major facilitator superfamily transporter n=1 Tax=Ceraceosorus guamensis TaxID=1522189 RepID=A0A316WBQ5_9BASI|nr:major facilitator superfamily transporter [Ceraceosorus guamensis]PWN46368.1 major facilitator superfamily transporter [Ceraceosorus guamensis]
MALLHARCAFASSATWSAQSRADAAKSKPAHELQASLKVGSSLNGKLLNQQTEPLFPSNKPKPNPEDIATQPSVYDDPNLSKFFTPTKGYENLHRFDPSFTWTKGEESRLIKRLDWRITAWACLAFFALDLGRGNLSQANTDNFIPDLGMRRNDYNLGNTIYQVSFLLAEIPSQMISKRLGADRWIPFIMIAWSIVSGAQFFLSGRTSFLVTRCLLGLLQGGFIPEAVLYLTYFFKTAELPLRLAIFWAMRRVADIVAPLLALGLLQMRGVLGYEGWRWLFLMEGIIMLIIGIYSACTMVASATQTKNKFLRPNGWFNEQEEKVLVMRVLRDDPSKGDLHNRQPVTPRMLLKALSDWHMWPLYVCGLIWEMPAGPPDQYFTLILTDLGFDTNESNLLSIPPQVGAILSMFFFTYISIVLSRKAFVAVWTQIWMLPCLVALATLPTGANPWSKFAILTVLLSFPSPHPVHVGWCSQNSNSVRTRAISACVYNMMTQLGRVIYSNIYREDDEPEYRRGNRTLVAICSMNICIYALISLFYTLVNRHRSKKWDAMTKEEQLEYMSRADGKALGNKRLDFRFAW